MQLGISDVARLLNVTEKTIYRWIQKGKLPAYKIGQQYRFNGAELQEWANAQRVTVPPKMFDEECPTSDLPSVAWALQAGGIHRQIAGETKREVLEAVVAAMHLPPETDRSTLLEVLIARENMGSTGIGDGIAIPHVRNPIVVHSTPCTIALCFLKAPIDFDAIDQQPVDTLFVLTSPTVRAHLHLISHLAYLLRKDSIRQLLRQQPSDQELLNAFEAAENQMNLQTTKLNSESEVQA